MVPAVGWRRSMLPPPACGGGTATSCISAHGTPTVPQNGPRSECLARCKLGGGTIGEIEHLRMRLVDWAGGNTAETGPDAAQPHSETSNRETPPASPGSASRRNRPGQRVDAREVETEQVCRNSVTSDLAAGEVVGLDDNAVAGRDCHHGRDPHVPATVGRLRAGDRVLGHEVGPSLPKIHPILCCDIANSRCGRASAGAKLAAPTPWWRTLRRLTDTPCF